MLDHKLIPVCQTLSLGYCLTAGSPPFLYHGTGSNPPGWKGWHFAILLTPNHTPFKAPYLSIALIMYSEQEGTNRQQGIFPLDNTWYSLMSPTNALFTLTICSSSAVFHNHSSRLQNQPPCTGVLRWQSRHSLASASNPRFAQLPWPSACFCYVWLLSLLSYSPQFHSGFFLPRFHQRTVSSSARKPSYPWNKPSQNPYAFVTVGRTSTCQTNPIKQMKGRSRPMLWVFSFLFSVVSQ